MEYVTKETLDAAISELTEGLSSMELGFEDTLVIRGGLEAFKFLRENLITSDKLRPMSEAPRDGSFILIMGADDTELEQARWNTHWQMWVFHDDLMIDDDVLIGWIPMPKVTI